jgi:hypothetical protein
MLYINLGSNCSVTYQLNKHKLRTVAFPFDWAKISIQQLNLILQNNFDGYSDISIKYFSDKYPSINSSNGSYVITNKYNIFKKYFKVLP